MSEILRWLHDDEQIDSTELLKVKLNTNLNAMEQSMNQAHVCNGIERADMYCTVCDKFTVGFNCGSDSCEW